jgi:hypothetical protein
MILLAIVSGCSEVGGLDEHGFDPAVGPEGDASQGDSAPQHDVVDAVAGPVASGRGRLARQASLATLASGSMELTAVSTEAGTRAKLPVLGGRLVVAATGDTLQVSALEIAFGDIEVELGDARLHLTKIRLSLPGEITLPATWSDGDQVVRASATPELQLDWALVGPDGRVTPLGAQRLRGLELGIRIDHLEGGKLVARIDGRARGIFWQWAQVVALSDGLFTLELGE